MPRVRVFLAHLDRAADQPTARRAGPRTTATASPFSLDGAEQSHLGAGEAGGDLDPMHDQIGDDVLGQRGTRRQQCQDQRYGGAAPPHSGPPRVMTA